MEMLTVSLDSTSSTPALRKLIRKHRIKFPVLHVNAEDGWNDGGFDWEIKAVPSSFLINPQGTIVGEFYAGEVLYEVLEYLMAQPQPVPVYGLEISHSLNEDGSYQVAVKVTSPDHQPIDIYFGVAKGVKQYLEEVDGEMVQIDPIPEGKEWNCSNYEGLSSENRVLEFTFEQFGEATMYIEVPAITDPNLWYVSFSADLRVPGTQELLAGQGISINASSDYWP